jgi:hypothetical protein
MSASLHSATAQENNVISVCVDSKPFHPIGTGSLLDISENILSEGIYLLITYFLK